MDIIKQGKHSYVHKYIKSTVLSVIAGQLATIVTLLIFSLIMCNLNIPSILIDIFIIVAASLGGLMSGYMNGRIIKQKGILIGSVSGIAFIIILILCRMMFFMSMPTWFTVIKILLVIMFSAFGGIMGVNKKTKRFKY